MKNEDERTMKKLRVGGLRQFLVSATSILATGAKVS